MSENSQGKDLPNVSERLASRMLPSSLFFLSWIERYLETGEPYPATTKEIAKAIASCTTMNVEEATKGDERS